MSITIPSYRSHELEKNPHHPGSGDRRIVVECAHEGSCSDGYHTFDELYEHRCLLYLAFLKKHNGVKWKARRHHDGSFNSGWFIVFADLDGEQITYHLPSTLWEMASFLPEHETAPIPWDGHSSKDVCDRLRKWITAL